MAEPPHRRRTSLDLSKLVESVARKRAALHLNLARDLPRVKAYSAQVRRAVMDLIAHASESPGARRGVVQVSTAIMWAEAGELPPIETGRIVPAGLYVCLEVSGAGTGQDLGAVLDIVRLHHGSVQVSSQPGAGTAVRMLFPALED